jgi:hypothetical protein
MLEEKEQTIIQVEYFKIHLIYRCIRQNERNLALSVCMS